MHQRGCCSSDGHNPSFCIGGAVTSALLKISEHISEKTLLPPYTTKDARRRYTLSENRQRALTAQNRGARSYRHRDQTLDTRRPTHSQETSLSLTSRGGSLHTQNDRARRAHTGAQVRRAPPRTRMRGLRNRSPQCRDQWLEVCFSRSQRRAHRKRLKSGAPKRFDAAP